VGAITQENSDTVPAGNVISQSPTGGTSVAAGSPVDLVVSEGPAVPLTVTSISPNSTGLATTLDATISGTGFANDAQVSFTNGTGPAPRVTSLTFVDSTTLSVTIQIRSGGPKRTRVWDVTVLSGGSSATLVNGFTIVP
jgi:beta-lactam-binding protein with PASTA domain